MNVGGPEILVILVVALLVLGPDRLPQAARTVGRFVGEARRMASGFEAEVREAMAEPRTEARTDPPASETVPAAVESAASDSGPRPDHLATGTPAADEPNPSPS